ncbi:ABC transporter permease [Streptomyces atratus]|uniref:ABC transporter permease n=1 Tax=Streptomyces atratus TaxID=1893 RepID=UPI0036736615
MTAMAAAARRWRVARISARYEVSQPGRVTGVAVQLALQIFLMWCLWRALYAVSPTNSGLSEAQALAYAVLGVLYTRLRGPDRSIAEDTVAQHVREGRISYWFLRPLEPRHYHRLRAIGDQAYGFAWAVGGYLVCLLVGLVQKPVSATAFWVFLVSLLLGQVVLYHLLAITDVATFWLVDNTGVIGIIAFAQSLFAGAIAPLWFFPGWFQTLSSWLPFQSSFHIPVSIYVGRIPAGSAARDLVVQLLWCLLLSLVLRWLWGRAGRRVIVQGG